MAAVSPAETLRVADDAVERRAHFGARASLARLHDARLGGLEVALRGVARALRRRRALREVMPEARSVFMRSNWRWAWSRPGRRRARPASADVQAVADRRVVEAHQQVAVVHRLAVFLETCSTTAEHFGAQVGAALGLDRSR